MLLLERIRDCTQLRFWLITFYLFAVIIGKSLKQVTSNVFDLSLPVLLFHHRDIYP